MREYIWQLAFSYDSPMEDSHLPECIVVNETEPEFKALCEANKKNISVAILFRSKDMEPIHVLNLSDCELKRVFRRRELDLAIRRERTIPVIEVIKNNAPLFCFAYPDSVVFTSDKKFHREEW